MVLLKRFFIYIVWLMQALNIIVFTFNTRFKFIIHRYYLIIRPEFNILSPLPPPELPLMILLVGSIYYIFPADELLPQVILWFV